MRKINFRSLLLTITASVAVVVVLSACGIKPDDANALPTQTVAEREAALKAFKPWRALGSIAIDSVEEGKYNASFAWDVYEQGFEIKLFGPLGVQVVHLQQDAKGARITDRKGTAEGQNAEALLSDILGTQVPITEMQDWAVGLPGDAAELQRDDIGRVERMVVKDKDNANWTVDFTRYVVVEKMYLPRIIAVVGQGVTIDLAFKNWSRGQSVDKGRLTIPGIGS